MASFARVDDGKEPVADGREQRGRQHPVGNRGIRCPRQSPEIGARPDELVPFGKDDPRAGIVELQPVFDLGGKLDGEGRVVGRGMGYRQHQRAGVAVFIDTEGGDDGARAILLAFVAAFNLKTAVGVDLRC